MSDEHELPDWARTPTPVGITSLIDLHEVCPCGSSIDIKGADAIALLAIQFWAERHKHHKAADPGGTP